jgi:predicted phosphodiesterase
MDFSFLHTADLHLGSPFLGLSSTDEGLARLVSSASREAFEELVAQAIERRVSFVVIAGDVYDGDWKDTTIGHFFNRQMARLARAGIPVFQVRGNHDAESVITGAVTLPPTVHSFSSKKVDTFRIADLKVALHGQSFANRAISENLALVYCIPRAMDVLVMPTTLHVLCRISCSVAISIGPWVMFTPTRSFTRIPRSSSRGTCKAAVFANAGPKGLFLSRFKTGKFQVFPASAWIEFDGL